MLIVALLPAQGSAHSPRGLCSNTLREAKKVRQAVELFEDSSELHRLTKGTRFLTDHTFGGWLLDPGCPRGRVCKDRAFVYSIAKKGFHSGKSIAAIVDFSTAHKLAKIKGVSLKSEREWSSTLHQLQDDDYEAAALALFNKDERVASYFCKKELPVILKQGIVEAGISHVSHGWLFQFWILEKRSKTAADRRPSFVVSQVSVEVIAGQTENEYKFTLGSLVED